MLRAGDGRRADETDIGGGCRRALGRTTGVPRVTTKLCDDDEDGSSLRCPRRLGVLLELLVL